MADRMTLELDGLMLERLLCRALSEGAEFSHIARLTRRRIAVTGAARSIRKLQALADRYHIENRVTHTGGFGALIMRMRTRFTVVAAFTVAAVLTAFFLSRIWIVDIDLLRGDSPPEGTGEVLSEAGIEVGAYAGNIDTQLTALQLSTLDGCAHASVRHEGVTMIVEIACEAPAPDLYEITGTGDLVALRDGVVSSVNVKSGTAMVKPGDTVRRGQVLIAGYERQSAESISEVNALGSVTARIWFEGTAQESINISARHYTGRTSKETLLRTPWLAIPISRADAFSQYDTEVINETVGGLFVPLIIERRVYREYYDISAPKDMDALKSTLEAESYASACTEADQNTPENAEIIDKWTDFSMIELDILYARTVIEVECEIAAERAHLEGN